MKERGVPLDKIEPGTLIIAKDHLLGKTRTAFGLTSSSQGYRSRASMEQHASRAGSRRGGNEDTVHDFIVQLLGD